MLDDRQLRRRACGGQDLAGKALEWRSYARRDVVDRSAVATTVNGGNYAAGDIANVGQVAPLVLVDPYRLAGHGPVH